MERAVVIKGRLVGPRNVELNEPVSSLDGDVEVIVRNGSDASGNGHESVVDFLRRLPDGTRSREDIDRQVREEQYSWRGKP